MRPTRIRDLKMKKTVLNYLVIAALAVAAVFTSCGGGGIGGSSGKIKMTTEQGGVFYFDLAGSGTATVDWGDGSEKVMLTLNEYQVRFEHTYSNATIRTITINGDDITSLNTFSNITSLDVSRCTELKNLYCVGQLTSLDVSKNTALTSLNVSSLQLTSLDVSKNIALSYLSVFGLFTADALNALFGTLHNNTVPPVPEWRSAKIIYINNNSGEVGDRSIAERKGWTFR